MFSLATRYFAATAKELHIIKGYLLPKPPTRPLAPFSCYLSQLSKEGKKPNLTNEVVNWKLLTDEQKKPFIEKSRSMKEKYEQSYNEYKEAYLNKIPSKGLNVYAEFVKSKLKGSAQSSTPNEKMTDRLRAVSRLWKTLPSSEVKALNEKVAADNKRLSEQEDLLAKYRVPKDTSKSAMQLFNENSRATGSKSKWSELSDKERDDYNKRAEQTQLAYTKELTAFCDKNGVTVKEFQKLVKKSQKKTQSAGDKTEGKSTPAKKVAKKATKTVPRGRTAASKKATTKKPSTKIASS